MTFHVPNQHRVRKGLMASGDANGNNGLFFICVRPGHDPMRAIAADGDGWEHVSVSYPNRCPTWAEMCHVKDLFWDPEDAVMQLHPPESEYVNNHPYCLHLWRPVGQAIPTPPSWMVGIKALGELEMQP